MQANDILKFFAHYIEQKLGIIYEDHNYYQLQNRLEELCLLLGKKDIQDLYQSCQNGVPGSVEILLLDLATNNETSFFRDMRVFKAIEKHLLDSYKKGQIKDGDSISIWSAASSTGQEPVSLAILLTEICTQHNMKINFEILASDISERVLQKAKIGTYTNLEVQRGLPINYLVKYFTKIDETKWQVKAQISKHIQFKKVNLKEKFFFDKKFDFVFCRNVLIYQNVDSKIAIINHISQFLKESGVMVLGSGESLIGLSSSFDLVNIDNAVIYSKKSYASLAA